MASQVMIQVGRTDLLHLLSAAALRIAPDPVIFQRLRAATDDPPEHEDDAEAQRIAEVFADARAELDRGL